MDGENRGVRIGQEMLEFVKANERIRPIGQHIVVEPLPVESAVLVQCWRPIRGRVLAAGPGSYPIKYDGPKGKRTKSWYSKVFQPTDVKVGDLVELGGKEIGGYLHPTIRWGRKEVVVCKEADVALIREE